MLRILILSNKVPWLGSVVCGQRDVYIISAYTFQIYLFHIYLSMFSLWYILCLIVYSCLVYSKYKHQNPCILGQ